jgi:hypothetical protein
MKTFKLILTALLAAQLLAACTDGEIQMTTTIERNGSCQRMVTFVADSATLVGSYDASTPMTHLLTDSTWKKNWCIKGDTARHAYPMTSEQYGELRASMAGKDLGDTVLVCAERRFASVEEMGAATPLVLNGEPLRPQVSLTKRFRWFYTDYVYEETYPSQRDLFVYPITDFVEEEVASYWFTGEPELMPGYSPAEKKARYDMVEEQCNRWMVANYVAEAFDEVAAMYDSLGDVPYGKADYMARRDSLVHYALDRQFSFGNKIDTLFSGYFHSHAYDAAIASTRFDQQMEARLDAFMELMGLEVDYRLVMPGKIRDVGTGLQDNGAVHYRLTGSRLVPADNYPLTATSRAVNVWAFLLTAALIVVAILWKGRK